MTSSGVGDDGDGEAVGQWLDHRQAAAVDGDGALLDDVAQQSGRRADRAGRAPAVTISPTASTWPWTRWPPRRSLSRTGRSRLTRIARVRVAPRLVRREGLVDHVGRPPARAQVDHGQAAAVDGDRVADACCPRSPVARRTRSGRRRATANPPELLDDSGEHRRHGTS